MRPSNMRPIWRFWFLHLWYDHGQAINPNGTTCLLCCRFIPGSTTEDK